MFSLLLRFNRSAVTIRGSEQHWLFLAVENQVYINSRLENYEMLRPIPLCGSNGLTSF